MAETEWEPCTTIFHFDFICFSHIRELGHNGFYILPRIGSECKTMKLVHIVSMQLGKIVLCIQNQCDAVHPANLSFGLDLKTKKRFFLFFYVFKLYATEQTPLKLCDLNAFNLNCIGAALHKVSNVYRCFLFNFFLLCHNIIVNVWCRK